MMLLDLSVVPSALNSLKPEYFSNEQNRKVYKLIARMFENKQDTNVISVIYEMIATNFFKSRLDATVYVKETISDVPSVTELEKYCKILKAKYHVRTKS